MKKPSSDCPIVAPNKSGKKIKKEKEMKLSPSLRKRSIIQSGGGKDGRRGSVSGRRGSVGLVGRASPSSRSPTKSPEGAPSPSEVRNGKSQSCIGTTTTTRRRDDSDPIENTLVTEGKPEPRAGGGKAPS